LKPIVLTTHAEIVATERELQRDWIERVARTPEWVEPDKGSANLDRRFGTVPERESRSLRVVCEETDTEIRVITVFLDRKAKKPA
jgi:hypothetical protein